MFLGIVTSPAERPHLLCHAGLDAEAGHHKAYEPEPGDLGSQAPAFDAGVRDLLQFFSLPDCKFAIPNFSSPEEPPVILAWSAL